MPGLEDVKVHYVDDVATAQEFMSWLGEDRNRSVLAYDLETSDLRPESMRIRLAQFGDAVHGWAIPWERWGGVALEALKKYQGPLVGHNIQFDYRFTKAAETSWSIPWHRTHDTMIMGQCLNPARPNGLKPLAGTYVDREAAAGQDILHNYMKVNKLTWETIPVDNQYYWMYGALDTVLTYHLYENFAPKIADRCPDAYDLEMAVYRVCANMMMHGVKVDLGYSKVKMDELSEYAAQLKAWCQENFNIENPNSNIQLVCFLRDQGYGETLMKLDERSGQMKESVDKEVLEMIDHPIADAVLKYRKATKICSAYFKNFFEFADVNNYIHSSIRTQEARTTRMSIAEPSFQNLPKRDKVVRNAILPDDGTVFISTDADQVELRIMAHFANDAGLKAAFESDQDFFCALASEIYNEPIDQEDPRRQLVKNRTYAKNYGAGDEKIAKTNRVPLANVKDINRRIDERFPGINKFMDDTLQQVIANKREFGYGFVKSYGGRQIPVKDDKDYVGVNYVIQSWAAACFKRAVVDLDAAGYGEYLRIPVHDEMLTAVPREHLEQALVEIPRIMTASTQGEFLVPLTYSSNALKGAWGGRELVTA